MDFPKPQQDTGVGVHDDANCYWKPNDPATFARILREHGISWYTFWCADAGKLDFFQELIRQGIVPIVRFYPSKMPKLMIDPALVEQYIAAGGKWFVVGNEFNLNEEWEGERPHDGPELCARKYYARAAMIRERGGWPLTPPPSLGGHVNHRVWFTRFIDELAAVATANNESLEDVLYPGGIGLHCRTIGNPLYAGPEDYDCSAREWEWFDSIIKERIGHSLPMANLEAFDEPNWHKRCSPELSQVEKWEWWRSRNLEQMRWYDPRFEKYRYPDYVFCNCFWLIHDGGTWNDCGLIDNYYYDVETGRGRETQLWHDMKEIVTWEREQVVPPPPPPPTYRLANRLKEAPYGFRDRREEIEALSDMVYLEANRRLFGDLQMVVVHHTGGKPSNIIELTKWAISQGHATIPYHFIVNYTGVIHFTAKLIWPTQHTYLHEKDAVGIAFNGSFVDNPPTPKALEACRFLIMALYEFFGQGWGKFRMVPVMPHFAVWNGKDWHTVCPGKAWDALIWGDDEHPSDWVRLEVPDENK